jgi:hypothetical protein
MAKQLSPGEVVEERNNRFDTTKTRREVMSLKDKRKATEDKLALKRLER